MESVIYGSIIEGLEIVVRDGHFYVRYDAGAHMVIWREDEITEQEYLRLITNKDEEQKVMFELQNRLEFNFAKQRISNWSPKIT